jgi:hypothetical protein
MLNLLKSGAFSVLDDPKSNSRARQVRLRQKTDFRGVAQVEPELIGIVMQTVHLH